MTQPLVCDFCNAPDPPWEYPAATSEMPLGVGTSLGAWCACDNCRQLIEAEDREGLVSRAVSRYPPDPLARQAIEMVQAVFWQARRGESRPVQPNPIYGRRFQR